MTIGLNILGDRGRSEADILGAVQTLDARYHVVMNNAALAAKIQALGNGRVIYRDHDQDDNAQDKTDPVNFVRRRHQAAPAGATLYLGNEPWPTQQLAVWTLAALKECARLGRVGVFFNFSVGNPEPAHWDLPEFRAVMSYAFENGHILGVHEYFYLDWSKDIPWYVDRFRVVQQKFGSRTPQIVVTEVGHCNRNGQAWKPQEGYRVSGLTDAAFGAQIATLSRHWSEFGVHGCLFAMTAEGTGDDWESFSPRPLVIQLMAAQNKTEEIVPTTVPKPTTGGVPAQLSKLPRDFVNLRQQPKSSAADVGDLYLGESGTLYPDAPHDGWVYFEVTDGPSGWVSLQGGAVAFATITTPTEPTEGVTLTSEQFNELKALHTQIGALIEEVQPDSAGGGF